MMDLQTFEENLMGTRVTVTLYSSGKEAAHKSAEKAFSVFRDLERQFSTYLEDSEISLINKNAGRIVKASSLMLETMEYALEMAKETNGIFNPLIGRMTTQGGITEKINPEAHKRILINRKNETILIPAGTALDLNSIVKGMALDMAVNAIPEAKNLMIEAGGDLRMKRLPPGENSWRIGIRNPMEPTKIITVLNMKEGAICTTGGYFRQEKAAKENRYHLVNPQDNKTENIATSMTVIAPSAKEADALSTAAFFMPVEQAVRFVEKHAGAGCLMIDLKNVLFAGDRMKQHFSLT